MKGRLVFLVLGLIIGGGAVFSWFTAREHRQLNSFKEHMAHYKNPVMVPKLFDVEELYQLPLFTSDGSPGPSIGTSKDKIIFIGFWASWCMPCHAEFPALEKLRAVVGDEVDFYLLTSETPSQIESVAHKYSLPFYSYVDEERLPRNLRAQVLPRSYVIKDGLIRYSTPSFARWDTDDAIDMFRRLSDEAG